MKKLFIVLLLTGHSTFGWTFTFTNKSQIKVHVTADCTATIDTIGYCLNSITVEALEDMKLINGTIGKPRKIFWKANCNPFSSGYKEATPLNCCTNQEITIYTVDFYGIEKQPITAFNLSVMRKDTFGRPTFSIRISEY